MKKNILITMTAALLMTTGCTTSDQFFGTMTGASLGGLFGSAIGGITGGPRGHDAGTIVGMAIGGAIGAAATAPKTEDGNYRSSDYGYDYGTRDYRRHDVHSPYADLEIQNVRFVDANSNRSIDAGEHAKLVFEIRNTGRDYIYDVAPVIGTKQIYLSPTAIISELEPGRGVRYQAEVMATNKLKNGTAEFTIGFSNGEQLYVQRTFQLQTRAQGSRTTRDYRQNDAYPRIE